MVGDDPLNQNQVKKLPNSLRLNLIFGTLTTNLIKWLSSRYISTILIN